MKKVVLIVVMVLLGASISVAGVRLIEFWGKTAPGSNKPPVTAEKPSRYKDEQKQVKQEPADNGNVLPDTKDPAAPGSQNEVPGEKEPPSGEPEDHTVYSWWFQRNNEHRPPGFDPGVVRMVSDNGYFLGDTSKKKVYLTFDEGYENGYTPAILDTLKANGVSAAFFLTGPFIDKNPALVRRMADEGHVLGNHTTTHPSMPKLTNEEIISEIKITHDKVLALTGQKMRFLRPPMGEYNSRVLEQVRNQGYQTVFWSMAYRDWEIDKQPGREAALQHVNDNLHPGAIILLHAVSQSNAEALDDIIKGLKLQGYTFESLNSI